MASRRASVQQRIPGPASTRKSRESPSIISLEYQKLLVDASARGCRLAGGSSCCTDYVALEGQARVGLQFIDAHASRNRAHLHAGIDEVATRP